jgi:hypothetical protein
MMEKSKVAWFCCRIGSAESPGFNGWREDTFVNGRLGLTYSGIDGTLFLIKLCSDDDHTVSMFSELQSLAPT